MTRSFWLSAASLLLGACSFGLAPSGTLTTDADKDGFSAGVDCDDQDPAIHPEGEERCDGLDNNCDGAVDVDAVDALNAWVDADEDGYGDRDAPILTCVHSTGVVPDHTDCDDGTATTNPGAGEQCNGIDDNCNGEIDTDAFDWGNWFVDSDGDGYGDTATRADGCLSTGLSRYSGDCDDTDTQFHPGADENDCTGIVDYNCDGSVGAIDVDGDGFVACEDCDDSRAAIRPGMPEICDALDNDCDGTVDQGATGAATWYSDTDNDGYGEETETERACDRPSGYAGEAGDCDDKDPAYNPGASELDCTDPADYNCDGSTGTEDLDGDGYSACEDCNDGYAAVRPGAAETCNSYDDDCDGEVDEVGASGGTSWYVDLDGDGYGDAGDTREACDVPDGYTADNTDCDDQRVDVNPSVAERCNGYDDDCDGVVDPDTAYGATTVFRDADRDEHGDPTVTSTGCEALTGWTEDASDCDDSDDTIYPGATERCNDRDDNCDGTVDPDDAADAASWYRDADDDGYGSATSVSVACEAPSGYLNNDDDCDDFDADVSPSGTESCNGLDDDCDGVVDESGANASWWYADTDGDLFGDPSSAVSGCTAPAGYVASDTDCSPSNAAIYPGAAESCNGLDDDCDGTVDSADAIDASAWYLDADGDSYGDSGEGETACSAPSGYVIDGTDCDDTTTATYPGAAETCDAQDNDCDSVVDESVTLYTWYRDSDGDGYGVSSATATSCSQPSGYVATSTDCNDASATTYPGASEACNSQDDDCDGTIDDGASAGTWYLDADGDGYGTASSSSGGCSQPAGYVTSSTDCNDGSATISPGASETCNSIDDDCDGVADDGAAAGTWYRDLDGDGYGDSGSAATGCTAPSGYVASSGDCNDSSATIRPGATETCNSTDDDCDGVVDDGASTSWWQDTDGDGYGNASVPYTACTAPTGYVGNDDDCNDSSLDAYPGGIEACDGLDNDCDGTTDDTVVYRDADNDGFGLDTTTSAGCPAPTGYSDLGGDCNDASILIHPYAYDKLTDGIDNDCDGSADAADPDIAYTASFTDDSYYALSLSTITFPSCGDVLDTIYITSNGRVTFYAPDTDYTETIADFNYDWTVAGAWDDLNPASSGSIVWTEMDGAVGIYYDAIREVGSTATNTFSIILMDSGRIVLQYENMALTDAIVGWSCVPTTTWTETNLSSTMTARAANRWGLGTMTEWAYYEYFTGSVDPLDLDNSVIRLCGNIDDTTDTCEQ